MSIGARDRPERERALSLLFSLSLSHRPRLFAIGLAVRNTDIRIRARRSSVYIARFSEYVYILFIRPAPLSRFEAPLPNSRSLSSGPNATMRILTRSDVLLTAAACVAFPRRLLATTRSTGFTVPEPPAPQNPVLRELLARMEANQPKQKGVIFPADALASGLGRSDSLTFPPWMEGRWAVTSRPLSIAAPLGRRFLPTDLARVRLGDLSEMGVPPLLYEVQFVSRASDGAIVSDHINNLRAVQDAAAGFARVETASFDGSSKLRVTCAPPNALSRAATAP